MSFIEQYLLQLNTQKRRWRRSAVILTALSLVVALVTLWNLRMTGITIANGAACGHTEHMHTEECPSEQKLICNADPAETADQTASAHEHTDACYEITYLCGEEEHIHDFTCYSDSSADVETAEIWEATIPDDLGKYWSENVARIALSQIGMRESERNFILAEDGVTKQGITRYGQWYGNPHGDWSAMFVAFCLYYADVPQDAIPWSPGVYNMMQLCADKQILSQPDQYIGNNGNLLFLDTDGNGNADKILIVNALDAPMTEDGMILAIGGDWDNQVAQIEIAPDDPRILAYVPTAAVREA